MHDLFRNMSYGYLFKFKKNNNLMIKTDHDLEYIDQSNMSLSVYPKLFLFIYLSIISHKNYNFT